MNPFTLKNNEEGNSEGKNEWYKSSKIQKMWKCKIKKMWKCKENKRGIWESKKMSLFLICPDFSSFSHRYMRAQWIKKKYKMFNRLICIKNNDNFLDSQMPRFFTFSHLLDFTFSHLWDNSIIGFYISHLLDFWTFVFFIFPSQDNLGCETF